MITKMVAADKAETGLLNITIPCTHSGQHPVASTNAECSRPVDSVDASPSAMSYKYQKLPSPHIVRKGNAKVSGKLPEPFCFGSGQ
jgi:hypothetical protein